MMGSLMYFNFYLTRYVNLYIYIFFKCLQRPCPEQSASFLSKLFFAWFDPLAWRGFRKPLETKDLWNMNPEDTSKEVVPKFDKYWEETLRKTSK